MPSLAIAALLALSVAAPTAPTAQSVGHYARGHIKGAVPLPASGLHHYLVLPARCYEQAPLSQHYKSPERTKNFYAHPDVVQAVQDVAAQVRLRNMGAPRIPVGELGNARGGRIPFHMSHQTGLDVDVLYLQRPMSQGSYSMPVPQCFDGPRFEVRDAKGWRLHPQFELAWNWALISAFAQRPDVRSIFVGGVVRTELLKWAKGRVPGPEYRRTKRRMIATWCRPPKGVQMNTYRNNRCPHDDHLHVRFHCPKSSRGCTERRGR